MEAKILEAMIELEALKTEREGMIAKNQERVWRGLSIAYDDEPFQELSDRIREITKIFCLKEHSGLINLLVPQKEETP